MGKREIDFYYSSYKMNIFKYLKHFQKLQENMEEITNKFFFFTEYNIKTSVLFANK